MFKTRHSPLMRALVMPVTLASFLSACSSWATLKEPVAVSIAAQQPDEVRVTRTDGTELMLNSPAVQADTLSGILPGTRPEFGTTSVALGDVASVETWRPSTRGESNWVATDAALVDLCAEQATQLRLTLTDERKVVIGSPQIEDGRVVGTALDQPHFPRTVIALSDAERVETYQGSNTVAIVLGVGAVVALIVVAVAADPCFSPGC